MMMVVDPITVHPKTEGKIFGAGKTNMHGCSAEGLRMRTEVVS